MGSWKYEFGVVQTGGGLSTKVWDIWGKTNQPSSKSIAPPFRAGDYGFLVVNQGFSPFQKQKLG